MTHASAATVHRACRRTSEDEDLLPAKRERGGANCRRGRGARALSASAGVGSLYQTCVDNVQNASEKQEFGAVTGD